VAGADGPRRVALRTLPLRAWPGLVRRTVVRSAKDRVTTAAASLAFHFLLALFPAMLALLGLAGLVGLTPRTEHAIAHGVAVVLPAAAAKVVDQALRSPLGHGGSLAEVAAGVAVGGWSAVEAMAALEVGLDVAFEVSVDRGFLRRRLVAVVLVGLTLVLGGVAFGLVVLGDPIARLVGGTALRAGASAAWTAVRVVGAIGAVLALVSATYAIGPNRPRRRVEWASPGAVAATLGWLGCSFGFSVYLDHFGHDARTYGTFAGVAVLLLWLFLSSLSVLFGAELDRELERERERREGAASSGGGADGSPGEPTSRTSEQA
jgi:membrane protein